jgi:hypothetical protein
VSRQEQALGYRPESSPSDNSKQVAETSAKLKATLDKYRRRWKKAGVSSEIFA